MIIFATFNLFVINNFFLSLIKYPINMKKNTSINHIYCNNNVLLFTLNIVMLTSYLSIYYYVYTFFGCFLITEKHLKISSANKIN